MNIDIKLPDFNHPEVRAFYEYDLSIPKEKVAQILQLPRATLIEDMEKMIMDCIQRDEFFRNYDDEDKWWSLNLHALWVLLELQAKETLPTLLLLLEQEDEFNWYWFSDYMTESLWEIFYHLGKDRLETLKEVLLKPSNWVCRIIPSHVAKAILWHHPERKQEILDWYSSVLDTFIKMEEEDEALDPDVISSIVSDLIGIQAKEFLPQIRTLYDKELIYNGVVGDMQSIEEYINNAKYKSGKIQLKSSIYDRYEDAMTWHGYQMKYNEAAYKESTRLKKISYFEPLIEKTTPIPKKKKVSKNAPCPCGSGKKYKRCCLNK